VVVGNKMIVFQGFGPKFENLTHEYSFITERWDIVMCGNTNPDQRTGQSAVVKDGVIYMFGGFLYKTQKPCNELYVLDLRQRKKEYKWSLVTDALGNIPLPCSNQSACVYKNSMFIICGFYGDSNLYEYRIDKNQWYKYDYTVDGSNNPCIVYDHHF